MNQNEKYQAWKKRSRDMEVEAPFDFSAQVMRRVHRQVERRQMVRQRWYDFLQFPSRSVQYAALAIAAFIGLCRFWLMFSVILKP